MSNVDTGPLHDFVQRGQAAQAAVDAVIDQHPASLAELLHRIAYGTEILPAPIAVYLNTFGSSNYVQVSGPADWEAWRQWLGAPPADPTDWHPYQTSAETPVLQQREWKSTTTWRGRRLELVRVEMGPAETVPADAVDALAAEIDADYEGRDIRHQNQGGAA